jgi:hypothetical protein
MHLLYLDDSGSAPNPNEEHLVLAGIMLRDDKIFQVNKKLDEIAERLAPGYPHTIEFHASEIWRGKTAPWDSMDRDARKAIISEVLSVASWITRDHNALFACAVHKKSYPTADPMEIAFEDLCSRFDLYLKRFHHETKQCSAGLVILDDSSHETSLQKLAINFRRNGTRWGAMNNLQEVPLFVDSKASRAIQIADAVAYAVFRRYHAKDLTYFDIIQSGFDSDGDRIHGLIHKHTQLPDCTCPACMTRKLTQRSSPSSD